MRSYLPAQLTKTRPNKTPKNPLSIGARQDEGSDLSSARGDALASRSKPTSTPTYLGAEQKGPPQRRTPADLGRTLQAQSLQNEPRRSQATSTKERERFTRLRLPSLNLFTSHLSSCPQRGRRTLTPNKPRRMGGSFDEGARVRRRPPSLNELCPRFAGRSPLGAGPLRLPLTTGILPALPATTYPHSYDDKAPTATHPTSAPTDCQHSYSDLRQPTGTLREAALRMTYKHTYRTHAALLRRLETLPSYRHSYASLPAI